MVRVRFAPSPTGFLHIGGARTYIFNWLFARQRQGTMVLRIDDTDVERNTEASRRSIFEGLEWLELGWDEQYSQSFVELRHGDVLLLYTDGLTEALNFDNEMFGKARIIEALSKGGGSAQEIAENVRWAMQRFVGLRKQSDDISMIVARLV